MAERADSAPASAEEFRWPGLGDRFLAIGRSGSGKSRLALWAFEKQPFDQVPAFIIDYKRDPLFGRMRSRGIFRRTIKPSANPPRDPGVYLMRPLEDDADDVDDFLWKVWRRGRAILWLDEARMPPAGEGSAMRAILTQGRTKLISVLALSQQPVHIDTFYKSEANHLALLHLVDREQRRDMARYMPINPDGAFPRYRAWWYDQDAGNLFLLPAAPDESTLLARIDARAPRSFLKALKWAG